MGLRNERRALPRNVLLVCYKIQDGKGSEDGSGYNIARRLAQSGNRLTIISRVNNVELLRDDPAFANARLEGVDVPRALSFYKRGGRGIIPYYYLWQIFVGMKAAALNRQTPFDIIHQLNFHTDWAPHFLPTPRDKIVWGPISHHKRVPLSFLRHQRLRSFVGESAKAAAKRAFWHFDPFLRLAAKRSHVLYADEDIAPPFRKGARTLRHQSYAASIPQFVLPPRAAEAFEILSVGRLVPLKGFAITIQAFAEFLRRQPGANARLTIIGSGPLERQLKELAATLGIDTQVRFVSWVNQTELADYYRDAALFVYPSFEGQGLVVAEAMAASVPVVCLKGTGPSFLGGDAAILVDRRRFRETAAAVARAIEDVFANHQGAPAEYLKLRERTWDEYKRRLDWDVVAANILALYAE